MKKRTKFLLVTLFFLAIWLGFVNTTKYAYPERKELTMKVNYLSRLIKGDYFKGDTPLMNAEWNLFSLSFTTFALTNIVHLDSSFKQEAVLVIDSAIQRAISPSIYAGFTSHEQLFSPKLDSGASVLYLGHLNLMLGCYRLISDSKKYNELNDKLTQSLHNRFIASRTYCLESYPGLIWIPDNTVAIASLKLHSQNTNSSYGAYANEWVKYAKKNWLEPKTGLLYSTVDPTTGSPMEEPRGCMLGWSMMMLYRVDEHFAKELYENYKHHFGKQFIISRIYKERYLSSETSNGDVDSGPLFRWYGVPANAFAFAGAVAHQDLNEADKLYRLIRWSSKQVVSGDECKYETRLLDYPISAVAEALLLYFETMTPWVDSRPAD